ncbi:MAG TPA: DUF2306 domain-containing protein [Puia sp.]|jgi:hypothetical protein|nr:DUF2306 domain-containing protein [Puia sp.]
MIRKWLWLLCIFLAIIIGLYPGLYFVLDRKFGLLGSKTDRLLSDVFWNIGFYIHIIFSGIALLAGWPQFSKKLRKNHIELHRKIGKLYVACALLGAAAGFYIAFHATGGMIASVGFICLALVWFTTTLSAYIHIKNARITLHQKMMIYSYAACFAAVTLRIWLPALVICTKDFTTSYIIVAWLCWIPNLIFAGFLARKISRAPLHQVIS